MYLKLVHGSHTSRDRVTWYKIFPTDTKGVPRLPSKSEKAYIRELQPQIEAHAKNVLGAWFHYAEYNTRTRVVELCFYMGVATNPDSKYRFDCFKGWLAVFSESLPTQKHEKQP